MAHPMSRDHRGGTVPEWTVGDRLRKAREFAGIGVEQMAERLGRQRNSITRWERSSAVQLMVVKLYALETGVPVEWLVGDDAPKGGAPLTSGVTLGSPSLFLVAA